MIWSFPVWHEANIREIPAHGNTNHTKYTSNSMQTSLYAVNSTCMLLRKWKVSAFPSQLLFKWEFIIEHLLKKMLVAYRFCIRNISHFEIRFCVVYTHLITSFLYNAHTFDIHTRRYAVICVTFLAPCPRYWNSM